MEVTKTKAWRAFQRASRLPGVQMEGRPDPQLGEGTTAEERRAIASLPIHKHRRWLIWTFFIVGSAFAAFIIQGILRKSVLQWDVIGSYLFDPRILTGLRTTALLTVISMALAVCLAIFIAVMRLSSFPPFRVTATLYVWLFRMIPLLVLLVVIYNIAIVYPDVSFGIPFGKVFVSTPTRALLSPFWVAVVSFALNEGASSAEIMRTSILAIPQGQWDAGTALGMRVWRLQRRIILPQALRIAVPPLFNDLINLLKSTALVAFIGVYDLFYTAETIYEQNFEVVPLIMVITIWYLLMILILNIIQNGLEQRYNRRLGERGR